MSRSGNIDLSGCRAVLFLPASNPRAIEKARGCAADLVILDLEDAVKPADKLRARRAAVEALASDWPMPVAIRVNGADTRWHEEDVAAAGASRCGLVVVPMVHGPGLIPALSKPIAAMIESAAGVLAASAIAREASALIVGTNDLAADLRLPPEAGRPEMQTSLQMVVLAARSAGIAVFDGVFNRLDDREGLARECAESRRLGFDGKTLIHPDQIAPCRQAFAPSDEEIARARRLLAAATGGAERFEGSMIERMHVEAARRLLEKE